MKTTAKHFEIFKKECEKWIADFGLTEWEVDISHCKLSEDETATCRCDYQSKLALIKFNTEVTDEGIEHNETLVKRAAVHEVLHLLLWDLTALTVSRFLTETEVVNKEHEVINKLANYILRRR